MMRTHDATATQYGAVRGELACFIRPDRRLQDSEACPSVRPMVWRSRVRRARFAVDLQPAAAWFGRRRAGADCPEWEKRPQGAGATNGGRHGRKRRPSWKAGNAGGRGEEGGGGTSDAARSVVASIVCRRQALSADCRTDRWVVDAAISERPRPGPA